MAPWKRRPTGPRGGRTTVSATGLRKTSVTLDPDDIRRLRKLAAELDTSLADLVRQAIRDFLDKQK